MYKQMDKKIEKTEQNIDKFLEDSGFTIDMDKKFISENVIVLITVRWDKILEDEKRALERYDYKICRVIEKFDTDVWKAGYPNGKYQNIKTMLFKNYELIRLKRIS